MGAGTTLDEALRALDRSAYDAIVVDLSAADPAGPDLVPALAGAAPATPIVVTTTASEAAAGLTAIRAGAQDHLVEGSFDDAAFDRTIRYAIERKRREQSLVRHARYDPLTDLANRTLFRERVEQALARAARTGRVVAVLWLDLDGFRTVTQGWERERSDELLRQVGVRLHRSVRQVDTVAHPAGDEFTILLEDLSGPRDAEVVAAKVRMALTEPLLRDDPVTISAGIGIGWTAGGGRPDDLLDDARSALAAAKEGGRGACRVLPAP
jgi:diguanylate cyclase (GGDEF)-like protein